MVGLSGGGWTTQLMAAIDPRIKQSVPVAGSAPLYVRNSASQGGTVGDLEQYYVPMYNENVQPNGSGGGVATWLEMYALGGYGAGRRQIQVTNEFDDCCFSGTFPNTYKTIVSDTVSNLGAGQWEHVLDSVATGHQISRHAIDTVIDPLFGIANPVPTPANLPQVDQFNNQTNAFPGGWSLDPASIAGTTALENAGAVTLRGPGLSSIVHDVPFNPQAMHPITLTMSLDSMTADNAMGVFITDDIAARPHHLGVLFLPGGKQIAVNADNGGGFDGAGDRVILGTLPTYNGGPATMSLTFDEAGFSVVFNAAAAGTFSSPVRPWSDVPNGFDLASLGENAWVFLQSFDTNGGTAASAKVNSLSILGTNPFPAGDVNFDGTVNIFDINLVSSHWNTAGPYGDANADGEVNIFDINLISAHWGETITVGGTLAPEPGSLAMVLLGAALLAVASVSRRPR